MKKGLFLLPLMASFVLAGCEFSVFGTTFKFGENNKTENKQEDNNNNDQGGNGGGNTNSVVLDFTVSTWKDEQITPYVSDNTTLQTFEYEGITYNDKGSFVNSYQDNYYLMMKNKWTDGKVEEDEEFAFIGNADSYGKAIKSIDVEVSKQTGAVTFVVAFGGSAFTVSSTTGTTKTVSSSSSVKFTATNTDSSQYWSLSATRAVGEYRKNGGIAKVTINF